MGKRISLLICLVCLFFVLRVHSFPVFKEDYRKCFNEQMHPQPSNTSTNSQTMINSPLGVQVGEDLIVKKIMPDISYRPLQDSVRLELVNQLSSVHESSLDHAIKLSVSYEIGNIGRQRVTEELVDILKSAGFEIDGPSSQSTYFASNSGIPKAITIGINRDDLEMFKAIFKPLQSFLKVRFPFDMRNEHAKGIISINIYGEPLFADDGTVTFPYYLPQ